MGRASYEENGEGFGLTGALMKWFWDHYADPVDRRHPKASPLRGDLSNLPPALIITAEFDPLRDEGVAYAEALIAAGVATRHVSALGHVHSSATMVDMVLSGGDVRAQLAEALRSYFSAPVGA
jgi:acetyl esterase/lipase